MCPAPGTFLDAIEPGAEKPRPIRRFVARFVDLLIAWILVLGLSSILFPRLAKQSSILLWIVTGIVWVAIEALLLYSWRTTPGKWLVKIRVQSAREERISFPSALDRSFTVFCFGLGCMIPFLYVFSMLIAYQDLMNTGTTRWDRGKFRVAHAAVGPGRIAVVVLVVLALLIAAAIAYSFVSE
jgi:protein-S-isoprenylcysteine O-methyltransferase Ste14